MLPGPSSTRKNSVRRDARSFSRPASFIRQAFAGRTDKCSTADFSVMCSGATVGCGAFALRLPHISNVIACTTTAPFILNKEAAFDQNLDVP
jgi:hypothetical protein